MTMTISGSTIGGLAPGGLPNSTILDEDIVTVDGSKVTGSIAQAQIANALNAPGSAPMYTCRAWVNFDATVAGTFAGGASTVTRNNGSTTATVTTTNPHGLIVGNVVYATSGVVAGAYAITNVPSPTTFTFTTAATTSLSVVAITFQFRKIKAAGNVSSVAYVQTGYFYVNMAIALPDANYCCSYTASDVATTWVINAAAANVYVRSYWAPSSADVNRDGNYVALFR